ncbi:hypothetical protein [Flavobacterium algicola]|uniref:hypothetical protein n=1 Tax=Flavobacterium algicola TaxID=556529 RepID=UPI001EFC5819|nr:hypothetical protein [Flavobacterium algicola]MCG9791870.1 hypothetical protein [Flavobacterium algicola]
MKEDSLYVKFQNNYGFINLQFAKMKVMGLILIIILYSCKDSSKKVEAFEDKANVPVEIEHQPAKRPQLINYSEFRLENISNFKLQGFDISEAFQLGSNKIVVGYDQTVNPDYDKDWGDKLLLLNAKDEILFKSKGVGDVFLFSPHFYKNTKNDKIIIVCQLGYEYYFGGEVFLYENGKIEYAGNIDIDGNDQETSLVNILKVNEKENRLIFTFDSDSITYKPGNEAILLKNNNIRYEYKDKKLKLIQ